MSASSKSLIVTFLVLATLFSAVFDGLIIHAGSLNAEHGAYALGLMWSPGVAAVLTRLVWQRNLRGFGWLPGKPRYLAIAYLLPVLAAIPVYGFVWLSGLAETDFSLIPSLGLGKFGPDAVWQPILFFLLVGPYFSLKSAVGEELGWRGLLVPELANLFGRDLRGFHRIALISAAIWSLYHYPILLFADYHSSTGWWVALPAFTLLVFTGSYLFAWLALKSGSFWPAALFHATHNLFIQVFFDRATQGGDIAQYITGEFGFGLPLMYGLLAWLAVRDVKKNGLPVIS